MHRAPVTFRHPGQPIRCRMCHRPVPTDTGDVCDRPTCQTRLRVEAASEISRQKRQRDEDWLEVSKRRTRSVLRQAAKEIGVPRLDGIAHGLAPYIDLRQTRLPEDRRAEFLAHLITVIDESFAKADGVTTAPQPPEDDPEYAERLAHEPPEPMALNASCIACQGDCCMQGASAMAFLKEETITCQRWKDPSLTRDDLIELYLSYLPETSTIGSCVYHGPQGCTLDRPWRANICNSFQCGFRRTLAEAIEKRPGTGAVVAGLSRTHVNDPSAGAPYLRVVSVSPDDTVTVLDHLKLPALRKGMPERDD